MSENLNNNTVTFEEKSHHSHHSHHNNHSHCHHHGRHHHRHHSSHSSRHHHSSGSHRHTYPSSRKNGGFKALIKKISYKLTPRGISSHNHLKKLANSTKSYKRKKYSIISKRVLFGAVLTIIFSYTFWYINQDTKDMGIKNASYTPSETSQLKIQVMQLEQENLKLRETIDRYIELYGELEEKEPTDALKTAK